MQLGRKITIFMIDTNAYVSRTAEIGNWTGKKMYSSGAKIEKILARDELYKSGGRIL